MEIGSPVVNVALLRVSILLLKRLGKITAFGILKVKTGKQFLAKANRAWHSDLFTDTVCPPDHVYSGYLEGLSDRKGKEFGRSRASKFLRKTCSAKRNVQYGGSLGWGDGRGRERKKGKETKCRSSN